MFVIFMKGRYVLGFVGVYARLFKIVVLGTYYLKNVRKKAKILNSGHINKLLL